MQIVYNELEPAVAEQIDAFFPKKNCFIEVLPSRAIVPRKFRELGESIHNFRVHPDDVWLVSYPRTGSTWAQEMIWLLGNQLDYEGAKKVLQVRSPHIELSALFSEDHDEWVTGNLGNTVEAADKFPRPRFMRSHLPWPLLPKQLETVKPKIIYTARNPKDLCVSYYHYCKLLHGLRGTFEDFVDLFLSGRTPMGSYWEHVLPFWKRSLDENVLFLRYEDMRRDLPATVQKCARFLNVGELSADDLAAICDHLQFNKMQNNPYVNLQHLVSSPEPAAADKEKDIENGNATETNGSVKFIRKGQIGDWKNYLTPEMSQRFDQWTADNCKGSGLTFDYEP